VTAVCGLRSLPDGAESEEPGRAEGFSWASQRRKMKAEVNHRTPVAHECDVDAIFQCVLVVRDSLRGLRTASGAYVHILAGRAVYAVRAASYVKDILKRDDRSRSRDQRAGGHRRRRSFQSRHDASNPEDSRQRPRSVRYPTPQILAMIAGGDYATWRSSAPSCRTERICLPINDQNLRRIPDLTKEGRYKSS